MAKYNILVMAMVKVSKLQHSKEIQEGKFQCWKCSLVGIRVSRSGDKSKIINSFELKILTERVGGMG